MKITLESTDKIVVVNGVEGRLWEGVSEAGIACHAIITRIGVYKDLDTAEFERELQERRPPSPVLDAMYSPRLVL